MKIAFFSVDGYGFPIAYHFQAEGHEVYVGQVSDWDRVHVKVKEKPKDREHRLSLYDNMFENKWKAERLMDFLAGQPHGRRSDDWFVFCDFNWLWPYADRLRKLGYRGLLPHREDYMLEHDRASMRQLVDDLYPDVETGDYHEFKKNEDGIEFLNDTDKFYVLKGFNAEAETIVPDHEDAAVANAVLVDALENDKDSLYEKDGFILEERIEDAIEFTPEAFSFDGQVRGINVDIEHKRFGSRNGPMTGCAMGLVLWQGEGKLWDKFLEPLSKRMLRKNELTVWDLSVFYSPSRECFYAGEFCPNRMGFDAVFAEISTFGSASAWLDHILHGAADERGLAVQLPKHPVGITVRVFNVERVQHLFLGDPADPNVWCFDVKERDGKLYTTGMGKDAYVLSASAETVDDAIAEVYQLEHDIEFEGGYCLQDRDWHDKAFPGNVLHRLEVVRELKLLEGGETNAEKKDSKNEIAVQEGGRGKGRGVDSRHGSTSEAGHGRGSTPLPSVAQG